MELYVGEEVIIDYKANLRFDVIEWFEEQSNFEGFATIAKVDGSYCYVEGCPHPIQLEYVITYDEMEDY